MNPFLGFVGCCWKCLRGRDSHINVARMKTCSLRETEGLDPHHVATLLEFTSLFEAPGFCPGHEIPVDEDGWPPEDFVKTVSRFMDACYKNGFVVRFNWEDWGSVAQGYVEHPTRLKEADLSEVRRLLTWHVRQNRFAKDHLAGMIARGHILAILRRLGELVR